MTLNDEKLKVQFEVDLEQLKKQLATAGVEFDKFGKQVSTGGTDKLNASTRESVGLLDVMKGRFNALAKAGAIAFSVDLVARALGFKSAMDAIVKSSEAAAQGIGDTARALISELIPALRSTSESTDAIKKSFAELTKTGGLAVSEKLLINVDAFEGQTSFLTRMGAAAAKASDDYDTLSARLTDIAANLDIFNMTDLKSIAAGGRSLEIVRQLNEQFAGTEMVVGDSRIAIERFGTELDQVGRTTIVPIIRVLEKSISATQKAREEMRRMSDEAGKINLGGLRSPLSSPLPRLSSSNGALGGQSEQAFSRAQIDAYADAVAKAIEQFRKLEEKGYQLTDKNRADMAAAEDAVRRLGRVLTDEALAADNERVMGLFADSVERARLQAELAADPFNQLQQALTSINQSADQQRQSILQQYLQDGDAAKLREFLALIDQLEAKQIKGAKDAATFSGSVRNAIRSIEQSVSNIGGQTVDVAFQSFRGMFRDIISGAASAGEAFRSFAASVVAGIADIIAQWLALQAVGFFFGVPTGGLSQFAASTAPAGAGAGAPIRGLGAGSGFGAQRGAPVTINLVVQSLDPRTAADVVLGAMPQIQGALAAVISGGSDRRLLEQLRAVRG